MIRQRNFAPPVMLSAVRFSSVHPAPMSPLKNALTAQNIKVDYTAYTAETKPIAATVRPKLVPFSKP
jgi:hypothetical protein